MISGEEFQQEKQFQYLGITIEKKEISGTRSIRKNIKIFESVLYNKQNDYR